PPGAVGAARRRRALLPGGAAADLARAAARVRDVRRAARLRRPQPGGLLLLVPRAARAPALARRRRRPRAPDRDGPARAPRRRRLRAGDGLGGPAAAVLQRVHPARPLLRRVAGAGVRAARPPLGARATIRGGLTGFGRQCYIWPRPLRPRSPLESAAPRGTSPRRTNEQPAAPTRCGVRSRRSKEE